MHNLTLLDGTHWHHRTALVVVADNALRRGVISLFHDHVTAGHPGITKTLQLLLQYYWWPNMKTFITKYIKGCATCQMTKVNTCSNHPPLFPILPTENACPFEWISSLNSHNQVDMTLFLQLQTLTAPKCQYSSPVTRPLTQKESPYSMSIMSFLTIAFPKRSFLTEMSASYQSSHQNSATFLTSNGTSVQHTTLKQMEQAKEPIKHLNNTCMSSAAPNRTIGTHGFCSPNIPRIRGPQQPQRKHHLTYS